MSIVQAKNPITNRWIKIDTRSGCIVAHKKSSGPYKNIDKLGMPRKISWLSKKIKPRDLIDRLKTFGY